MNNICSITGKTYEGKGHNAYPFPGRCCDEAHKKYVIPARKVGVTPKLIEHCGMNEVLLSLLIVRKIHNL